MTQYNEITVTIKMVVKQGTDMAFIADSIWDCLENGEDILEFNQEINVENCGPVDNEV